MTTETARVLVSSLAFIAAATAAVSVTPSNARALSDGVVPIRLMVTCPNPAPYWCEDGKEFDTCPDGTIPGILGCADVIKIQ